MNGTGFNEADHTYWLEGRRVTGITEALEGCGLRSKPPQGAIANFEYAGKRGSIVHKMRHLSDIGERENYDFDESLLGYLDAWDAFKKHYGLDVLFSEKPLVHPIYQFGGTPDCAGFSSRLGKLVVVEAKTSAKLEDWIGLQLAGQMLLLQDVAGMAIEKRLVVRLESDGQYEYGEYGDRTDKGTFLATVTIANRKLRGIG